MITDQGAVAYLKETSGNAKSRSVKKGDSVNGMLVAEVAPDRVKLTLGDETEDVELKVAKGPKTTVQPTAVAAAPASAPVAAPPQGAPVVPAAGAPPVRRAPRRRPPRARPTTPPPTCATRAAPPATPSASRPPRQAADGTTNTPQPSNSWQDTTSACSAGPGNRKTRR
jgi:hypothetical protein